MLNKKQRLNINMQIEAAKEMEKELMDNISKDIMILHDEIVIKEQKGRMQCNKPNMQEIRKPLIAKIQKIQHAGTSYFADCPYCGKTKILSSELNSMSALCDKDGCYKFFNLEN